jgi:hypothetical protein
MKRSVGTFALLAFLFVGAAPCAAANMRCGMKMPSAEARCASCAAEGGNVPLLLAASCCRVEPGQDRSTPPAVLSGPAPASQAPVKALVAVLPAPTGAQAGAIGLAPQTPPRATGPPPSFVLTTVLRL